MKLAGSRPFSAAARTMPEPHMHAPAGAPAAATPAVPISHDMAHDMGHGAGMDMHAMVRDMRNRFWISLVFSVPIFAYSPMGMDFVRLKPPFGLDLNVFLFLLASAAIIFPAWPLSSAPCGRCATASSIWLSWWSLASARATCSALGPPFSSRATSSMKHRRYYSSSSCSVIGWRCGRERGLREPSGRCSIWRHQWR